MSYYTYECDHYPVSINLGAAGDCEIDVHVCVDIDYEEIINEMGDAVWDYIADEDVGQRVLNNHKDYMENMVEEQATWM